MLKDDDLVGAGETVPRFFLALTVVTAKMLLQLKLELTIIFTLKFSSHMQPFKPILRFKTDYQLLQSSLLFVVCKSDGVTKSYMVLSAEFSFYQKYFRVWYCETL